MRQKLDYNTQTSTDIQCKKMNTESITLLAHLCTILGWCSDGMHRRRESFSFSTLQENAVSEGSNDKTKGTYAAFHVDRYISIAAAADTTDNMTPSGHRPRHPPRVKTTTVQFHPTTMYVCNRRSPNQLEFIACGTAVPLRPCFTAKITDRNGLSLCLCYAAIASALALSFV